ncbi:methyl-accepting chemotaxis protein [Marinobacterium jannaschii]|uniref:methyl-accepting chemotaxis protein n=1 Tax=Marinobacterium jannaschii TaxID=64970 RepID=UPI000A000ACD|nr:methyl-accepting chemotaxis protein [Marinobacterium jannaschii]
MRSFWEFQNIRLPVKFALAIFLLTLGLVFMGASYYQTILLNEAAQQRQSQLDKFINLITEVELDVANARFHEKSLMQDHDLETLNRFDQNMSLADKALQQLAEYLRSEEDKQLIGDFQLLMDSYQDTFYEGAEAAIEAGLTADQGLTGEIRQAVREAEPLMIFPERPWLSEQFAAVRKALNEFSASGGLMQQSGPADKELERMVNQLEAAGFTDENEVLQRVTSIRDDFSDLKEAIVRRDNKLAELQGPVSALGPKIEEVTSLTSRYAAENNRQRELDQHDMLKYFFGAMFLMTIAMAIALSIIKYGVIDPIKLIQDTVEKVRSGDSEARSRLDNEDELGQLATLLDSLLDEKENALKAQEEENKRLNASVIELIQNVFRLSQRDLTVRVPVAEDITGAVADSINQLAVSMESVLHEVSDVATRVNTASKQVKTQSATVLTHASQEQQEIQATLEGLESATKAMQLISRLATLSNTASQKAIHTSETAMESVSQTITSINKIRQTIHEAEKRIKRLGDRSQEIGGIVSLINNISERTHVLSLNASMHAASAGEAGRGLMVVVDEVQRLAENSREATSEIESLVNNIQLETADTINVINAVIADVVDGTRQAEEAGERMGETRSTTQTLVESVVRIAQNATKQAQVAEKLRVRADSIDKSTQATNQEMVQQSALSDELVEAADELQRSISVFTLAQPEATAAETPSADAENADAESAESAEPAETGGLAESSSKDSDNSSVIPA